MSLKSDLFLYPASAIRTLNAAYSRPPPNPYSQTYNPELEHYCNLVFRIVVVVVVLLLLVLVLAIRVKERE